MATRRVENDCGTASGLVVAMDADGAEAIRLPAGSAHRSLAVLHRFGVWAAIVLESDVPPGMAIDIEVGEPLRPDAKRWARFVSRNRTYRPEYPRDGDWSPLDTDPLGGPSPVRLTAREDLLRAEFESLRWCEAGDPEESLVRLAWTWFHLDMNTHGTLLRERSEIPGWPWKEDADDHRFRERATEQLLRWLTMRASVRWKAAADGLALDAVRERVRSTGAAQVHAPERWVPHMAAVLRSVFSAWHPNVEGDLPRSGLVEACVHFAGGAFDLQLEITPGPHAAAMSHWALHVTRGQPDSIAVVLFAEMAIASVEAGVNVAWWTNALRAFIAMLGPFQCAYGVEGHPAHPDAYTERCLGRARPFARSRSDLWMGGLESLTFDGLERAFGARLTTLLSDPLIPDALLEVQRARGRVHPP